MAATLVLSAGAPAAGMSGPTLDYALNCQGCHRADGTGTPGSVPPLAGSVGKFLRVPGGREYLGRVPGVAQAPLDDAALAGSVGRFLRVPGGREYLARVPGVAQAPLDDAAVARLLNWMLERFDQDDLPHDFVPYAPDEIGRLRTNPLTDVERVRRELLAAIESGR